MPSTKQLGMSKKPKTHSNIKVPNSRMFDLQIEESQRKGEWEPEKQRIDYVLVHRFPEDEDEDHARNKKLRQSFENTLRKEYGIVIKTEKIGKKVYKKLHCPFKSLCAEAQYVNLEMPLKDSADERKKPKGCFDEWVDKHFFDDETVDAHSAMFDMDRISLFENYNKPTVFFRPALRSFLVHQILINVDIKYNKELQLGDLTARTEKGDNDEEGAICGCLGGEERNLEDMRKLDDLMKINLPYLLMRKVYTETLVLHEQSAGGTSVEGNGNKTEEEKEEEKERARELQEKTTKELEDDPRLQLDKTWTKYFMFQPFWRIRNYFGEKVAMYFAWSGHLIQSLFLPMIAGFAIFIYGLVKSIESRVDYDAKDNSTESVAGLLDTIRQSFDNDVTPFFAMAICIWGTLFLEFWKRQQNRLSYLWDVDEFEMNEPDRPEFYGTEQKENPVDPDGEKILNYPMRYRVCKLAVSGLTLLFMVCLVLCSVVAVIVYRIFTSVDFCPTAPSEVCLMVTTIISSLLNAISILILSKLYDWLARKLTDWENHRTQTKYDDSLIIKLFAFQFVNNYTSCFYIAFFRGRFDTQGIFDLGPKYTDKCEGTCMSQLSFQVLTLMLTKPLPKLFSDVVLPFLKRKWRNRPDCMRCNFGCSGEDEEDDLMKKAQEDPKNLTFLERELMKEKLGDFTLGEYTEKVIMYGFLMLFAASFPLAPLIAIVVTSVDIRIDANRLLWWFRRPVAFIAQDIGTWQIILQLINFIGVVSNAFLIAFTSNWGSKYGIKDQLWIVIGFEHLVLVLKFVVAYLIPDIPADVALARRKGDGEEDEERIILELIQRHLFNHKTHKMEKALDELQQKFLNRAEDKLFGSHGNTGYRHDNYSNYPEWTDYPRIEQHRYIIKSDSDRATATDVYLERGRRYPDDESRVEADYVRTPVKKLKKRKKKNTVSHDDGREYERDRFEDPMPLGMSASHRADIDVWSRSRGLNCKK